MEKRKDNKGRVLKENEVQRANGTYEFRWRTLDNRKHSIYAKTLQELREKEDKIQCDKYEGIRAEAINVTLNDVYVMWKKLKKLLKGNTFQNYIYMYEQFVFDNLGQYKILSLKRSDVRRFYNYLADERGLRLASIDGVHTVLHQVLDLAVEDGYLRNNISDNALKELKQTRNMFQEKKFALTIEQQNNFINFLQKNPKYSHWYPIFAVMLGTGLRVGEATGLRWCDVDFENNTINVNHTLVYYNHSNNKCYFGINTPKTKAGERTIPMIDSVREALLQEKEYQTMVGIKSISQIDGFSDFIFVNRFGNVQHQGTLNKAIRRVTRDCNSKLLDKPNTKECELLPRFSCHTLRHTFTTRLCESGINIKVIQSILGHSDVSTTLDIYADVTKDLKKSEMCSFDDFIKTKIVA